MGNTFGFEPATLPSYISSYYDYVAYEDTPYDATPWDDFGTVNIDTMWRAIQEDSDEEVAGVGEMWRRLSVLLESTRSNLERYATALQQAWSGPAAEKFLERVGAALYSLDEWQRTADTNANAMNDLCAKISTTQTKMRDVWERYTAKADQEAEKRHEERTDSVASTVWNYVAVENPMTHDDVRRQYTDEAKPHMRELSDMYLDTALRLERGEFYHGPTTARQPVMPTPPMPGGLGGVPSVPTMPSAPALPFPDLPPLPQLPQSGAGGPELAGLVNQLPPGAPPLPGFPAGTEPLPSGPAPGGPPLAGQPVAPPGAPRPPLSPRPPATPGAGGAISPAGRPAAPRPTLPGTSARTGVPGQPNPTVSPGTPRRPNLRGTATRPAAAAPSGPGTVPPAQARPAPPKLQGRRAAGPAASGSGQPGGRPPAASSPGSLPPQLAGRRPAGGGAAASQPKRPAFRADPDRVLGGRTAPGTGPQASPATPPTPQLGGRRAPGGAPEDGRDGGTGTPGKRPVRAREHGESTPEEDLWTVDPAAPPVVDAPAPPPTRGPSAR